MIGRKCPAKHGLTEQTPHFVTSTTLPQTDSIPTAWTDHCEHCIMRCNHVCQIIDVRQWFCSWFELGKASTAVLGGHKRPTAECMERRFHPSCLRRDILTKTMRCRLDHTIVQPTRYLHLCSFCLCSYLLTVEACDTISSWCGNSLFLCLICTSTFYLINRLIVGSSWSRDA